MNAWAKIHKKCAESDGIITSNERCGMSLNNFTIGVVSIVELVIIYWVRNIYMANVTCDLKFSYSKFRDLLMCLMPGQTGLMTTMSTLRT